MLTDDVDRCQFSISRLPSREYSVVDQLLVREMISTAAALSSPRIIPVTMPIIRSAALKDGEGASQRLSCSRQPDRPAQNEAQLET